MDPGSASVMFAKDRIIDGRHTLLPRLEAFIFVMVDQDNRGLYSSVTRFLREREKLRMLDLGSCPWDLVRGILCDLRNLRVLGVHIHRVSECVIHSLLRSIPTQMVAINLSVDLSEGDLVRILLISMCQLTHMPIRMNMLVILLAAIHCPSCISDLATDRSPNTRLKR